MRLTSYLLLFQSFLLVQTVWPSLELDQTSISSKEESLEQPLYLTADTFTYDAAKDIVTATGNVILVEKRTDLKKEAHVLHCDNLVYNKKEGTVLATGSVSLKEPSGDTFFVPEIFIHDSFQKAHVTSLKALLSDLSRLVAAQGQKVSDDLMILQKASYTPCKMCELNPKKQPAWKINAQKVIYDKKEQSIIYHNATIDLWGIPVFYTPYFRHPEPKVKRKSGFLMPSFFSNSDLGFSVSVPYYYAISPYQDLTFTPIFTSKQGPVLAVEHRKQLADAFWSSSVSFTQSKNLKKNERSVETLQPGSSEVAPVKTPNRDRFHIFTRYEKHVDEHRRFIVDLQRASDTTYLRRYPVQNNLLRTARDKNLTSQIQYEDFRTQSYGVINAYAFQTDKQKTTPYVLPSGSYFWHNKPGSHYGNFSSDTQILSLLRAKDTPGRSPQSLQRVSQKFLLDKDWVSNFGMVTDAKGALDFDGYFIQRYKQYQTSSTSQNYLKGRFHPKASLGISYPLIAYKKEHTWLIEPKAALLTSPRISQKHLPNEDCLYSELDESNLFSLHRFHGRDRMDVGSRAVLGTTVTWFGRNQAKVSWFLGQSYRLDKTDLSPVIFGEKKGSSDYVSKLTIRPNSWLNLVHKARVNRSSNRLSISETTVTLGNKKLAVDTTHTFLSSYSTPNNQPMSQISLKATSFFTDEWAFSIQHSRNLKKGQGGALSTAAGVQYENDCLVVRTGVYETTYRDRDIQPDKGVILQVVFKSFGTFAPLTGPQAPFSS